MSLSSASATSARQVSELSNPAICGSEWRGELWCSNQSYTTDPLGIRSRIGRDCWN